MTAHSSQSLSDPSGDDPAVAAANVLKTTSAGTDGGGSPPRDAAEPLISYWRRQLTGIPAILELPTDRPRLAAQSYRAACENTLLPRSLKAALQRLGVHEAVPLSIVLLAAFQILLRRHTRQDDIVVGCVITDSNGLQIPAPYQPGLARLPIRADMSGDPPFRELLVRLEGTIAGAIEHANLSWERLVEAVEPDADASRHPIFQALFSFEDCGGGDGAVRADLLKTDLWLQLRDEPHALAANFIYCADLFNAETIRRMAGHFRELLEGVVSNPGECISRLPLLTEAERHQLLHEWNDTWREYPHERCVQELFEAQVTRTPDALAVVFENEHLSYAELNRRANQLARYLMKVGVEGNALVGICVERSLEMVVGLLGILKAGGAYVPVDPAFPPDRIGFMLEDAEAPVLLTQEALAETLPAGKAARIRLDADWPEIAAESGENVPGAAKAEDLAYTIYTSGSTGKPKGVQIPHRAVVNFLISMAEKPGMTVEDRLLAVTTLSFDIAGLEIFLPLTIGASVEIVSRSVYSDGNQLLRKLLTSGATMMQATPATWRMLLEAGWRASPGLKILVGGEAVASKLAKQLMQRSASVWNVYGPTETTIWSTIRKFEPGEDGVSIGRPIANTEIFILDTSLQPVPIGVTGELMIGGDGLARGYFKRTELTAEKFIPHPFRRETGARVYRTGDLARYLPNGDIEFLGRIDHQVKIRGFRIELGEIEAVLRENTAIKDAVAVAREDVAGDKRVVAYFVPAGASPTARELREFLRKKLPEYMIPSLFVSLEKIPMTPNGKVDRRSLPAPGQADIAAIEQLVTPRDEVESKLVRMWQDILRVSQVGVRHDFFELGGHSLLAARLMTQISAQFHVNLPIATLFHARTIEQLARIIRDQGWKPSWSSLVAIQPLGSKPPFFCVHGIGGNVLGFYELATHLGTSQPFYGLQAQGLDGITPPHSRAEEMAAHYVHEIRELQPNGPYFLGGLSFGGAIAFEMARQLQAQGEEVGLLALFDTFVGKRQPRATLLVKLLTLPPRKNLAYVAHKIRTFIRNLERLFLPLTLRRVRAAHRLAHSRYVMQRYEGRVTLFTPHDPSLRASEDPQSDWKQFATVLEMHEVPGDHETLLDEPHVRTLAQQLRACIDQALYESERRRSKTPDLSVDGYPAARHSLVVMSADAVQSRA